MISPLFDGPAPPAPLFEGPLYVLGRRRPGPNRWGYDPFSPPLDPLAPTSKPHDLCVKAAAHWRDRETWEKRDYSHAELIRRRKKGCRRQRDGAQVGRFLEHDTDQRKWKRGDRTSTHHRIMAWMLEHASIRDGASGIWRNGRMGYCTREQLARYVRCPARADKSAAGRRRVRTYMLDRAIDDLIAAGLLMKIPQANHPGILKLRPLAWLVSGVGPYRDRLVHKAEKRAEELERRRQGPPTVDPAEQLRAYVAGQASAHVAALGPFGAKAVRKKWGPDDPPPDDQ